MVSTKLPVFRSYVPNQPIYNQRIGPEEWKSYRPTLDELRGQGLTRKQIVDVMRTQYGFKPSIAQLNSQFCSWGLKAFEKSSRNVASQSSNNLLPVDMSLSRIECIESELQVRAGTATFLKFVSECDCPNEIVENSTNSVSIDQASRLDHVRHIANVHCKDYRTARLQRESLRASTASALPTVIYRPRSLGEAIEFVLPSFINTVQQLDWKRTYSDNLWNVQVVDSGLEDCDPTCCLYRYIEPVSRSYRLTLGQLHETTEQLAVQRLYKSGSKMREIIMLPSRHLVLEVINLAASTQWFGFEHYRIATLKYFQDLANECLGKLHPLTIMIRYLSQISYSTLTIVAPAIISMLLEQISIGLVRTTDSTVSNFVDLEKIATHHDHSLDHDQAWYLTGTPGEQ